MGSPDIYNEANRHFFLSGKQFEYGRPDRTRAHQDTSRLERDLDGDGKLGVDCSSFVWRGLKNAGYDVPGNNAASFTTHSMFNGSKLTSFARENFDAVSAADARKPNGSLQPGDILMFKTIGGSGQHVGIFKGYDSNGHIQYIGSQGSTGPAVVTIKPGGYWDGGNQQILGALRAKPEFQVREPLHGHSGTQVAVPNATPAPAQRTGASSVVHLPMADGLLKQGEKGIEIITLQATLNALGGKGTPIGVDGDFGSKTLEAVKQFQRAHGLEADGIVGPKTFDALGEACKTLSQAQSQATPQQAQTLTKENPLANDPLYQQAYAGLKKLDPACLGFKSDQEYQNVAGVAAFEARVSGLQRIDHMMLNRDGSGLAAMQGQPNDPANQRVYMDKAQAAGQPVERSASMIEQDAELMKQHRSQEQTQAQAVKPMMV